MTPPPAEWEEVLRAAVRLQRLVPDATLVGGTAAALHAGHRKSNDADHVLPNLRDRFEALLRFLESQGEWTTNRVAPPTLILGEFHGVETGLRQLVREAPLETTVIDASEGPLRVPTLAEMLRIKGWLIVRRNATRDYIDFAALAARAGPDGVRTALASFDRCYRDVYSASAGRDVSPGLQLARQLAEPRPHDLDRDEIATYKGIVAPWTSWDRIAADCRSLAVVASEAITDSP